MLLHQDCTSIIHIATSLQEILLKFGGELGAYLCSAQIKQVYNLIYFMQILECVFSEIFLHCTELLLCATMSWVRFVSTHLEFLCVEA